MSACDGVGPRLDAHHDGELGALERWRVRRHLSRCSACREKLAALERLRPWVRSAVGAGGEPDLWAGIAARLPAPEPTVRRTPMRPRWGLVLPALGASAMVAAGAGLLVLRPDLRASVPEGVVRSINTHGRPVMVLEHPEDATIIWLMDEDAGTDSEEAISVWI